MTGFIFALIDRRIIILNCTFIRSSIVFTSTFFFLLLHIIILLITGEVVVLSFESLVEVCKYSNFLLLFFYESLL